MKMMMKAEIAKEMVRSRIQTPKPAVLEAVAAARDPESRAGSVAGALSPDLGIGIALLYTEAGRGFAIQFGSTLKYRHRGAHVSSSPEPDGLSRADLRLFIPAYAHCFRPVGVAGGRERRPGLQRRSAAQGNETAGHPAQRRTLGRGRAISLPDPCL